MEDSRDRVRVDHQVDYATGGLRLRAIDTTTGRCVSMVIAYLSSPSEITEQVLKFAKQCDVAFGFPTDWEHVLRDFSGHTSSAYRASTVYGYKAIKPELAVAITYDAIPPEEVTTCSLPRATLRNHIMLRFGLTLIWLSKLGDTN